MRSTEPVQRSGLGVVHPSEKVADYVRGHVRHLSGRDGRQCGQRLHAHMMGSFAQTLSAITWVATSYSIAEMIMITMAGWWSALIGRKRLYLASFILFTLGSALAGTSQTFTQMLIYRIIQGIGGGSLIPISQAILRETFPPEEQGHGHGHLRHGRGAGAGYWPDPGRMVDRQLRLAMGVLY